MGRIVSVLIAYAAIVGVLTVAGAIPKLPLYTHALLLVVANVAWPVLRPGILSIPILGDLIAALEGNVRDSAGEISARATTVRIASAAKSKLLSSVEANETSSVIALINGGMQASEADANGTTALMLAAKNGNTQLLLTFLDAGAPIDKANREGLTALAIAAEHRQLESARLLLDRGARVNPHKRTNAGPALYYAIVGGSLELVKLFVERGASVNVRSPTGVSMVQAANQLGHREIAEYLVGQAARAGVKH